MQWERLGQGQIPHIFFGPGGSTGGLLDDGEMGHWWVVVASWGQVTVRVLGGWLGMGRGGILALPEAGCQLVGVAHNLATKW